MANEDRTNAGAANENAQDGKDGEPRILGWFYAFDADDDPHDPDRLIWMSLEEADDGGRETSIHADNLLRLHAENRPLLLADVKLLGEALAGYEDAEAKGVTFRRYAFSCADELPEGVMPIARFTAEVGRNEEGMTVTHRCAVNDRLKPELLVGAQRLVAGMIENLPRLFDQLEESERNDEPSTDAIADIASDLFDKAGGAGAGNAGEDAADSGAPAGTAEPAASDTARESKVFGYFYAYDESTTVDDPGMIARISAEPDDDGGMKLGFSLSSFLTDSVDNCGAMLAFVSQLYDVLPRSDDGGSVYRRYAFTNRSEPPEHTLPLGRIVVEFEDGRPVGSHCEAAGDERLHDALIGASHIIGEFGPYMRQVLDRKQTESGAHGDD
ncbi:hypothetical protein JS528_03540 [Bifidobacterium sp. MA2]|uniref:Uncharacterized protein n=1 Tax=Bifidobacterium santillanense TaxID=2809028 RepID=A0ABS5UNG4_9BIFI|nr:hypothetical protein [Bifidobacterium santillanense]MBT1172449.1 hypothetical protein [Bifidobacterium santillanense]